MKHHWELLFEDTL